MTNPATPVPLQPLAAIPAEIRCAQDYETLARRFIAAPTYEYIAGGSGRDLTVDANLAAFARWSVYPRLLRDVSAGHTRVRIGADTFAHPVMLAPVAFHKLVHPSGELETARAAQAMNACMVASTLSSCTLEDVARVAGPRRWFQLYFQPGRAATRDLRAPRRPVTAPSSSPSTPRSRPPACVRCAPGSGCRPIASPPTCRAPRQGRRGNLGRTTAASSRA
jgi:hypothetical protein